MSITSTHAYRFPIPAVLNLSIALSTYALAIACLWLVSAAINVWSVVLGILLFSYLGNTIFSLLHESVHGVFHPNPRINYVFGCMSAVFFPTSFSFHRVCHLGHHRRNRSDVELFDYYTDPGKKFVAYYRLYCLLSGFYWLSIPVGCLLLLLASPFFHSAFFRNKVVHVMGLKPMVEDLVQADPGLLRREIGFTLLFQCLLIWSLDLTLTGWLLCYVAFALNWCALQYADHAWSVRDVKEGSWNLKIHPVVRWIFLNYHFHLVHHRHPKVPWLYLPRLVDPNDPQPSFWSIYWRLWKGPRLTSEPAPVQPDAELMDQVK
ncbi:MAG: fatty acid desaturase [Gammaproteobacteria bacterium]|nr:fatty acid desaturase [Gammaproteobacteria bacterium]MDH5802916.1 fatty acid desaturase [Gammaproteobacteria bacterium]